MQAPYQWSENFSSYIHTMTWGKGYLGEQYWQEEENWLKQHYAVKNIERVLSIGCGLFRELETLRTLASKEVIGIDSEKDFIDFVSKETILISNYPTVKLFHGCAEALPFERNFFDLVVILFNTLSFVSDPAKALFSISGALKKDGEIVISFWNSKPSTTDYRIKVYTQTESKSAYITTDSKTGLKKIVVKQDEKPIFHSLIITNEWVSDLIRKTLPLASIEFSSTELTTIVKIIGCS